MQARRNLESDTVSINSRNSSRKSKKKPVIVMLKKKKIKEIGTPSTATLTATATMTPNPFGSSSFIKNEDSFMESSHYVTHDGRLQSSKAILEDVYELNMNSFMVDSPKQNSVPGHRKSKS